MGLFSIGEPKSRFVKSTPECQILREAKKLNAQAKTASKTKSQKKGDISPKQLLETILTSLDDSKAEETTHIDITGKSPVADYMVVSSGRSHRHVNAVADRLLRDLKDAGIGTPKVEGMPACDWVLVDTGDVIVHIFRPEVRDFYSLEKLWNAIATDQPA